MGFVLKTKGHKDIDAVHSIQRNSLRCNIISSFSFNNQTTHEGIN